MSEFSFYDELVAMGIPDEEAKTIQEILDNIDPREARITDSTSYFVVEVHGNIDNASMLRLTETKHLEALPPSDGKLVMVKHTCSHTIIIETSPPRVRIFAVVAKGAGVENSRNP